MTVSEMPARRRLRAAVLRRSWKMSPEWVHRLPLQCGQALPASTIAEHRRQCVVPTPIREHALSHVTRKSRTPLSLPRVNSSATRNRLGKKVEAVRPSTTICYDAQRRSRVRIGDMNCHTLKNSTSSITPASAVDLGYAYSARYRASSYAI